MIDIPRNELLDKLATGWKVRRKDWPKGWAKQADICQQPAGSILNTDLIADDWEGEPPEPVRNYEGCSIVFAFKHLKEGAAFIRRPSWDKSKVFKHSVMCFALNYEDIQTSDWEVWG